MSSLERLKGGEGERKGWRKLKSRLVESSGRCSGAVEASEVKEMRGLGLT